MGTDALAVPGNWNSQFAPRCHVAELTRLIGECVLFIFHHRRASPGAEDGHGPVPVLHLWIPARHHGVVRGERGGLRGQTLPALPGHFPGLPLRVRGWGSLHQHPHWQLLRTEVAMSELRDNAWQNSCREKLKSFSVLSVRAQMCCASTGLD